MDTGKPSDFNELAREMPPADHMDRMLRGARDRLARHRRARRMARRTGLVGGIGLALYVGLLLIPFSYQIRIGTLVAAEWDAPAGGADRMSFAQLEAEGLMHHQLTLQGDRVKLWMGFKQVSAPVARARAARLLDALLDPDVTVHFQTEEIIRDFGVNALAAITGGKITLHVKGTSDEEIEREIRAALAAHGFVGGGAEVKTTPSGERRIDIRLEGDPELLESKGDTSTIELEFHITE